MKTRIDFDKLRNFVEKNNKSLDTLLNSLNISLAHWCKLEESAGSNSSSREISDGYLNLVADHIGLEKRFFLKNTLRVVVNDVLALSWENTKNIDHDHIFHDAIGDLELTEAECILLLEGSQIGVADCTLQAQDRYEHGEWAQLSNGNIIRPEILEWLLMPAVTKLLFKAGGLIIRGTMIGDFPDHNPIASQLSAQLTRKAAALRINDSVIDIDLAFNDCQFLGGIDFSNSIIQSLTFRGCVIRGSFIGNNLSTTGDISIFASDRGSGSYLPNPPSVSVDEHFDIFKDVSLRSANISGHLLFGSGVNVNGNINVSSAIIQSINLAGCIVSGSFFGSNLKTNGDVRFFNSEDNPSESEHSPTTENEAFNFGGGILLYTANVSGHVHLGSGLHVKGTLDFRHLTCIMLTGWKIKLSNPEQALDLDYAKISGEVSFQEADIMGSISADYLQCNVLNMGDAVIRKPVKMIFAVIRHLHLSGTQMLGDGTSFCASGLTADSVFMRDGFIALCGVELHKSTISFEADFGNSMIGPGKYDCAVTLSGCSLKIVNFESAIVVGTILLRNSVITSRLVFEHGVFLNLIDKGTKAINGEGVRVGNDIRFNPSDPKKVKNAYSRIVSNSEKKPTYNAEDIDVQILVDRLQHIEKKYPAEFDLLHHVLQSSDYDQYDTVVIGETSFDGAEINGRMDFAGTLFYGTAYSEYSLKNSSNLIIRTFKTLNDFIIGKFLILIVLLFPATILFFFKILAKLLSTVSFKLEKRWLKYERDLQGKTIDDFISLRVSGNWPNALTLSHIRVNGDLFLNRGKDNQPFKAVGEVDLRSAKMDNFFLAPSSGSHPKTIWKITGLKYEHIFSDALEAESLEDCGWFFDYVEDNNYKQPYEQLASSYIRMGNDVSARKVLIKTPGKTYFEKLLMALLALFAWLTIPPYRALVSLLCLWFLGKLVFLNSYITGAIVRSGEATNLHYSPDYYSLHLLVPFISTAQKEAFYPSFRDDIDHKIYIPFRPDFLPDFVPQEIDFPFFDAYHTAHSVVGTILVSLFLLGIARIIRNS